MKKGLVLEGGAMRGLFTAGVLDIVMEKGIEFDGAVGVSAGAAFGCNIKSRQIGRALRYNLKYCSDSRYASLSNLINGGNLFPPTFATVKFPFPSTLLILTNMKKIPWSFTPSAPTLKAVGRFITIIPAETTADLTG